MPEKNQDNDNTKSAKRIPRGVWVVTAVVVITAFIVCIFWPLPDLLHFSVVKHTIIR